MTAKSITFYSFVVNRNLEQIRAYCPDIPLKTAITNAIIRTRLDGYSPSDPSAPTLEQSLALTAEVRVRVRSSF